MNANVAQRPDNFSQYIGQQHIIANLKIYIAAAKKENRVLDHILIYGPSGMGKTSLANLVAHEMKKKMIILNGPSLQKPSDIISPLTTLKENEFLFIDEIHAVAKEVLEVVYPVLESNELNIILGKDYNSKIINIKLQPFTMICATTEINKLPAPFINRFSINFQLTGYNIAEITKIILNYGQKINFVLSLDQAQYLAQFTKLNPRIAINVVKRVHDYFLIEAPTVFDTAFIAATLQKLQIYQYGLSHLDVAYLQALQYHRVLGLDSLAQILNTPQNIIVSQIEPVLLKNALIKKTFRGREITEGGSTFLNALK